MENIMPPFAITHVNTLKNFLTSNRNLEKDRVLSKESQLFPVPSNPEKEKEEKNESENNLNNPSLFHVEQPQSPSNAEVNEQEEKTSTVSTVLEASTNHKPTYWQSLVLALKSFLRSIGVEVVGPSTVVDSRQTYIKSFIDSSYTHFKSPNIVSNATSTNDVADTDKNNGGIYFCAEDKTYVTFNDGVEQKLILRDDILLDSNNKILKYKNDHPDENPEIKIITKNGKTQYIYSCKEVSLTIKDGVELDENGNIKLSTHKIFGNKSSDVGWDTKYIKSNPEKYFKEFDHITDNMIMANPQKYFSNYKKQNLTLALNGIYRGQREDGGVVYTQVKDGKLLDLRVRLISGEDKYKRPRTGDTLQIDNKKYVVKTNKLVLDGNKISIDKKGQIQMLKALSGPENEIGLNGKGQMTIKETLNNKERKVYCTVATEEELIANADIYFANYNEIDTIVAHNKNNNLTWPNKKDFYVEDGTYTFRYIEDEKYGGYHVYAVYNKVLGIQEEIGHIKSTEKFMHDINRYHCELHTQANKATKTKVSSSVSTQTDSLEDVSSNSDSSYLSSGSFSNVASSGSEETNESETKLREAAYKEFDKLYNKVDSKIKEFEGQETVEAVDVTTLSNILITYSNAMKINNILPYVLEDKDLKIKHQEITLKIEQYVTFSDKLQEYQTQLATVDFGQNLEADLQAIDLAITLLDIKTNDNNLLATVIKSEKTKCQQQKADIQINMQFKAIENKYNEFTASASNANALLQNKQYSDYEKVLEKNVLFLKEFLFEMDEFVKNTQDIAEEQKAQVNKYINSCNERLADINKVISLHKQYDESVKLFNNVANVKKGEKLSLPKIATSLNNILKEFQKIEKGLSEIKPDHLYIAMAQEKIKECNYMLVAVNKCQKASSGLSKFKNADNKVNNVLKLKLLDTAFYEFCELYSGLTAAKVSSSTLLGRIQNRIKSFIPQCLEIKKTFNPDMDILDKGVNYLKTSVDILLTPDTKRKDLNNSFAKQKNTKNGFFEVEEKFLQGCNAMLEGNWGEALELFMDADNLAFAINTKEYNEDSSIKILQNVCPVIITNISKSGYLVQQTRLVQFKEEFNLQCSLLTEHIKEFKQALENAEYVKCDTLHNAITDESAKIQDQLETINQVASNGKSNDDMQNLVNELSENVLLYSKFYAQFKVYNEKFSEINSDDKSDEDKLQLLNGVISGFNEIDTAGNVLFHKVIEAAIEKCEGKQCEILAGMYAKVLDDQAESENEYGKKCQRLDDILQLVNNAIEQAVKIKSMTGANKEKFTNLLQLLKDQQAAIIKAQVLNKYEEGKRYFNEANNANQQNPKNAISFLNKALSLFEEVKKSGIADYMSSNEMSIAECNKLKSEIILRIRNAEIITKFNAAMTGLNANKSSMEPDAGIELMNKSCMDFYELYSLLQPDENVKTHDSVTINHENIKGLINICQKWIVSFNEGKGSITYKLSSFFTKKGNINSEVPLANVNKIFEEANNLVLKNKWMEALHKYEEVINELYLLEVNETTNTTKLRTVCESMIENIKENIAYENEINIFLTQADKDINSACEKISAGDLGSAIKLCSLINESLTREYISITNQDFKQRFAYYLAKNQCISNDLILYASTTIVTNNEKKLVLGGTIANIYNRLSSESILKISNNNNDTDVNRLEDAINNGVCIRQEIILNPKNNANFKEEEKDCNTQKRKIAAELKRELGAH